MQENNSENNTNKTPHKMARLAWPKAKYGAILAIIIIKNNARKREERRGKSKNNTENRMEWKERKTQIKNTGKKRKKTPSR